MFRVVVVCKLCTHDSIKSEKSLQIATVVDTGWEQGGQEMFTVDIAKNTLWSSISKVSPYVERSPGPT